MLVKFKNAEVPVWKLRKGTVLQLSGSGDFVHLESLTVRNRANDRKEFHISCQHYDNGRMEFSSEYFEWLESH